MPDIDGLNKETVLTSWMAKFDCILKGTGDEDTKKPSRMQQPLNSEMILSKEQLFDMFQQILGIKKFEHQILYNALMVSDFSSSAMDCVLRAAWTRNNHRSLSLSFQL